MSAVFICVENELSEKVAVYVRVPVRVQVAEVVTLLVIVAVAVFIVAEHFVHVIVPVQLLVTLGQLYDGDPLVWPSAEPCVTLQDGMFMVTPTPQDLHVIKSVVVLVFL